MLYLLLSILIISNSCVSIPEVSRQKGIDESLSFAAGRWFSDPNEKIDFSCQISRSDIELIIVDGNVFAVSHVTCSFKYLID